MTMQPAPEHCCPVCGLANQCVPAREGSFEVACWCTTVHIRPEALARIPGDRVGKACLCPRCAAFAEGAPERGAREGL